MKVEKFEDLKCWQAARQLVKLAYAVSGTGQLARDFDTKSQFRKAALSSMNNIAEGFGRFGKKDSIRYPKGNKPNNPMNKETPGKRTS